MKLRRLDLARYGHLTGLALDFPDSAGVHVLLGPNEAGKSTALAAIADALFGFGHRTEYDFLHGGPQLRLGFAVCAADGREASFWRRKGRGQTLRDAADQPVSEDALRGFLGGTTRQLFEQAFGLNGQRLREGAAELLRSGGEAGESLLAGMGLMHLRAVAEGLGEEAKALAGDGRGLRRLSAAAEAWRRAGQSVQAAAVRPTAWAEVTAAHERLQAELSSVQVRGYALASEQSRLERVRRVRAPIAQLQTAREALAAVADAPRLPDDAEDRHRQWADQKRDAQRDHEREAEARRTLAAQRDAVAVDAAVLALEPELGALLARRLGVLEAERDLPGVRAVVAEQAALVHAAGQTLGSTCTPAQLREALPGEPARRAAQRAIDDRIRAAARIGPAREACERASRKRDALAAALAVSPPAAPAGHLRQAVDDTRSESRVEAELQAAERELALAEDAVEAALRALALWQRDAAALAAAPVPLEAEARRLGDVLLHARRSLEQAGSEAAALGVEIAAALDAVALLAQGGPVPTRAAVAAARHTRDALWQRIRDRLAGDDAPVAIASPGAFEAAQDAADRLADQRADEAGRVADYELKTGQLAALRRQRDAAAARLAAATADLSAAEAAWAALWAPCGVRPHAPDAMAEWRRDRAEVLRLAAAASQARARREALACRRDTALALLASLFPSLPRGAALAATLVLAEAACRDAEAAIAARAQLAARLAEAERALEAEAAALRQAQADLDASGTAWIAALATLGVPADAAIEVVQAAQAAWTRIAEAARLWRSDERRVRDMQAAVTGFDQAVRSTLARLGEVAAEAPAVALLDDAGRRLAAARVAQDTVAALTERMAAHAQAATAAERLLREAERELSALRALAGAEDDAALATAIVRARRRAELEATAAGLERLLAEQGDGHREAALQAEIAAVNADAAPARLAEIEAERAALGSRRETLATAIAAASGQLAAMAAGGDAAARAQEAEDALAEARGAAERYARLHVARTLLHAGIDRFRRAQQGPLLQAAGENFRVLTSGRYVRLVIDQTAAGEPLIQAVRPDGEECPVKALSEGTRDQLYLALRVAAIQSQVAVAEPLPFVADDLLVQFDDARAEAAITLLARLGRQTQVLLFTHHRHMAELAAGHAGVAVQTWPSGPQANGCISNASSSALAY